MELTLERSYFPDGTNGSLYYGDTLVCFTIELPWRENASNRSCIPEGSYPVVKRFSNRHQFHLELLDVPGRSLILIHKANDAQKELRGCIAPVSRLTDHGKGTSSGLAFQKLYDLVVAALEQEATVEIRIRKAP